MSVEVGGGVRRGRGGSSEGRGGLGGEGGGARRGGCGKGPCEPPDRRTQERRGKENVEGTEGEGGAVKGREGRWVNEPGER